jgi:hypothetical protein
MPLPSSQTTPTSYDTFCILLLCFHLLSFSFSVSFFSHTRALCWPSQRSGSCQSGWSCGIGYGSMKSVRKKERERERERWGGGTLRELFINRTSPPKQLVLSPSLHPSRVSSTSSRYSLHRSQSHCIPLSLTLSRSDFFSFLLGVLCGRRRMRYIQPLCWMASS